MRVHPTAGSSAPVDLASHRRCAVGHPPRPCDTLTAQILDQLLHEVRVFARIGYEHGWQAQVRGGWVEVAIRADDLADGGQ
jgi:hypothetical protein